MQPRRLGLSELNAMPLALGGNVFGWTADEATSFRVLDAFVGAGFNLIDTADVYSSWAAGNRGGESEAVIGGWLKRSGARERVLLATKVGKLAGYENLRAETVRAACERSLNRLGVDTIDLYQAHADDATTPLEETLGAFAELISAGKVRAIGASNYSGARLAEALAVSRQRGWPRYETLQPHYNLVERREFEADLLPVCEREGVSVIPYYALASGFLTGKYRTAGDLARSPRGAKAGNYLNPRGRRALETLDAVAAELGATCAQVALAWLAARPTVAAPIASATSVDQFAELAKFADLRLTAEQVARLDAASAE